MRMSAEIFINQDRCILNGKPLSTVENGKEMLKELYHKNEMDYPKFYKMDGLCRLGFIASELLLSDLNETRFVPREDRAVVLISHHGCLATDTQYDATIEPGNNYFPSPSLFVYTLPNIVSGEISIRNKYHGETMMYIMDKEDKQGIEQIVNDTFMDTSTTSVLIGWIEYIDDENFETHLKLIENK